MLHSEVPSNSGIIFSNHTIYLCNCFYIILILCSLLKPHLVNMTSLCWNKLIRRINIFISYKFMCACVLQYHYGIIWGSRILIPRFLPNYIHNALQHAWVLFYHAILSM